LQTSKTDNSALDIDAIYNLKLRKTLANSTDGFTTKLNAKFPWPPIMPKPRWYKFVVKQTVVFSLFSKRGSSF
jgi:hypothetical protein